MTTARCTRTSRTTTPADHSGYQTGTERIEVLERIFGENDRTASRNRADFAANGVCAINLMSSPGAGKTTLLAETLRRLTGSVRIGVVEGDIETSLDADRLAGFGAAITLVNTGNGFGGECHLDAPMVRSALPRLPLAELDLVLIENVGNLVCPAEFDIGEHARAMVYADHRGRGQAAQVSGHVPVRRPRAHQQDRPAAASGLRPRRLPRQPAGRQSRRHDDRGQRPHLRRAWTSGATGCIPSCRTGGGRNRDSRR